MHSKHSTIQSACLVGMSAILHRPLTGPRWDSYQVINRLQQKWAWLSCSLEDKFGCRTFEGSGLTYRYSTCARQAECRPCGSYCSYSVIPQPSKRAGTFRLLKRTRSLTMWCSERVPKGRLKIFSSVNFYWCWILIPIRTFRTLFTWNISKAKSEEVLKHSYAIGTVHAPLNQLAGRGEDKGTNE